MKQKIIIKHSPTSIRHSPMRKVSKELQNLMPFAWKTRVSSNSTLSRASQGPRFCSWPPFLFCRLRLAPTVVLSKNALHLDHSFVWNIFVFLSIDVLCGTKVKCCFSSFSTLGLTIFSYAAWFLYLDFPWFDLLLLSSTHILHEKLPYS